MNSPFQRALALAGLSLAATVIVGVGKADAAVTAGVTNGTLQITSDKADDTIVVLRADPSDIGIDVGGDGTLDYAFPLTKETNRPC